jgi:hypothetical protein
MRRWRDTGSRGGVTRLLSTLMLSQRAWCTRYLWPCRPISSGSDSDRRCLHHLEVHAHADVKAVARVWICWAHCAEDDRDDLIDRGSRDLAHPH